MRLLKICMKASAAFAVSLLVWYAGCCTYDQIRRGWQNYRWRQEQIKRGDNPNLLDDWRRMRWVNTVVDTSMGVPQVCLMYAFWGRNFPDKDIPDRAFFSIRTAYDKDAIAVRDWEVSQAGIADGFGVGDGTGDDCDLADGFGGGNGGDLGRGFNADFDLVYFASAEGVSRLFGPPSE